MSQDKQIEQAFDLAAQQYAELGVDVNQAMKTLATVPISMHCWQGDDVGGFETAGAELSGGGIQATGNYPGKARTIDELRQDIEQALSMIPGQHRLNLHASYLDNGGTFVDRNEIDVTHFQSWIDWARANGLGMDFNGTYFSHAKAADGFTLSHQLGTPTVTNVWVPDGHKDIPIDRFGPRERLADSLDKVFAAPIDPKVHLDAVESKLFGIGAESYTTGSHEFYMGYAVSRQKLLCLDAGHFHPTEVISEKISSALMFLPELLLHVSRPVRWDSDHVVILSDELQAIAQELVRSAQLNRVHIGLDFFDASINRVAAWVIGTRSMLKALLMALLEPTKALRDLEAAGDYTSRLAMLEELKTLPFGAVWDHYCVKAGVPVGRAWLAQVKAYEKAVLSQRA
jgi:L-rhamnose isomerase